MAALFFWHSPGPLGSSPCSGAPSADELIRRIRQALAEGLYVARLHARVRVRERGITDAEALEVIMHEGPF